MKQYEKDYAAAIKTAVEARNRDIKEILANEHKEARLHLNRVWDTFEEAKHKIEQSLFESYLADLHLRLIQEH